MLSQLLERLILGLFALLRRFYGFARDNLHARMNDRKTNGAEGQLAGKPSWRRAAIVTIGSEPYAAPLLLNLLNGFSGNDFFVLVVAGRELPAAVREPVRAHCHYLLEGMFLGPDGCTRAGWEWMKGRSELKDIETLALASDGAYYPRRIASTIGQMLAQETAWQCLFENRPQDSFHLFRTPVFTSEAFSAFCRDNAVSAARLQALATGKAELADTLIEAGFTPNVYYNTTRLGEDVSVALSNENIPPDLQDVLNLTLGFEKSNRRTPRGAKDSLSLPVPDLVQRLDALAKREEPVYAVGLLCNYLYQAPIRRDIGARGLHEKADIIALMQGFSTEEKEYIAHDWRRENTPANLTFLHKLPRRLPRMTGRVSEKPTGALRRN